jgi:hypothetical protein
MKYGGRCEYLGAALLQLGTAQGRSPESFQLSSPCEHGMSLGVGSSTVLDSNAEKADMSPTLLLNLELMHYYTAHTCLTISDFISFNHIWQVIVPNEAQSHPFLMYGILATAALHIGRDRPQGQEGRDIYIAVALKNYNAAIASFRAALKQVTADNCSALFAFSAMLVVLSLAFAHPHPSVPNQNVVDELIQIFTLLQGVRVVLQSAMPWVEQGPLGPLLRRGAIRQQDLPTHSFLIPRDFDEALAYLERRNERVSELVDSREMYNQAIQKLRVCLEKIEANPGDRAAALNWLVFLESSYVSSLKSKQPLALVILAHYGVVLHSLREHWFLHRFGIRVIEAVHLSLGEDWKPLVHWPMRQVGLRDELPEANERTGLG